MTSPQVHVGVLALQGAFSEHIQLLKNAFSVLEDDTIKWNAIEVRTPEQLLACDALIIPGGESTAMALVAARSGLLEQLRTFVKARPVWGTCAGMILLAEAANRTKQGGQDLIGGLDVRVNRNYFGRQVESFEEDLHLHFLGSGDGDASQPFKGVFIRAPIVERILSSKPGVQIMEQAKPATVIAPSRTPKVTTPLEIVGAQVEVLAILSRRRRLSKSHPKLEAEPEGDIVAVRQGNVFATSFHPELTEDSRLHVWWLREVRNLVAKSLSESGAT